MKSRIFEFRSIKINEVEKIVPHLEEPVTVKEMDENSIEKHRLEITFKDIVRHSAWMIYFLLSFMVTAVYSGLLYAAFYFLLKNGVSPSLPIANKVFLIVSSVFLFAALWGFFSIKGGIAGKKRSFVVSKRGEGNWKLIDEDKFENFYRLLLISKKAKTD